MAVKLTDTSKGIAGENYKKIGTFQEATGGGTPLAKGEKLKDHPEAHRVSQPRDENGQFTYNSVNGKELKYGPSRGTTVPPFLKGIKLTFCQPGTKLKVEGDDGIKVKLMTIDMSVEQIVANCKEYLESEGEFKGMGKNTSIDKKGRMSKAEKEAGLGQIGTQDTSKLSQKTQDKMAAAAAEHKKSESENAQVNPQIGNFQVTDDTLNPNGTTTKNGQRYHQWSANNVAQAQAAQTKKPSPAPVQQQPQPTPQQVPVTPSGAPVNNNTAPANNNTTQPTQKPQITLSGMKGGLSQFFGKNNPGNNGGVGNQQQGQNKFANLNASMFSNLFKK